MTDKGRAETFAKHIAAPQVLSLVMWATGDLPIFS